MGEGLQGSAKKPVYLDWLPGLSHGCMFLDYGLKSTVICVKSDLSLNLSVYQH